MVSKRKVRWSRWLLRGVALTIGLAVFGVVNVMLYEAGPEGGQTPNSSRSDSPVASGGWGAEALNLVEQATSQLQLIPLANACGLGASSCFRCHNGKRAGQASPNAWHTEHEKMNNSCVACHGGNPRLMKEKLSHKGMLLNPMTQPDKYCFDCHNDDKAQVQLEKYNNLLVEVKEHADKQ